MDAHDNDTICAPAARALAEGLAANIGTIATLALTDMKMGAEALRVVLHALGGSGTLRRLDLRNLCSRWTVANTLGRERGALLAELIRGWARRGQVAAVLVEPPLATTGSTGRVGRLGAVLHTREEGPRISDLTDRPCPRSRTPPT